MLHVWLVLCKAFRFLDRSSFKSGGGGECRGRRVAAGTRAQGPRWSRRERECRESE